LIHIAISIEDNGFSRGILEDRQRELNGLSKVHMRLPITFSEISVKSPHGNDFIPEIKLRSHEGIEFPNDVHERDSRVEEARTIHFSSSVGGIHRS
jgi:hypothetical protein